MFDPAHAFMPLQSEGEGFAQIATAAADRMRPMAVTEINSSALLQGEREILIRHGGECYRLRHTRNDKLILTK